MYVTIDGDLKRGCLDLEKELKKVGVIEIPEVTAWVVARDYSIETDERIDRDYVEVHQVEIEELEFDLLETLTQAQIDVLEDYILEYYEADISMEKEEDLYGC